MKRTLFILSASLVAAVSFSSLSFAEGDKVKTAAVKGDAIKGARVFKKCKACHTVNDGGKNLMGPNLFGIVDKKAGLREGYKYSKAMLASGLTWDEATLNIYLKKPKKLIKKTKMSFAGLKKEKHRTNIIAYLKTLK